MSFPCFYPEVCRCFPPESCTCIGQGPYQLCTARYTCSKFKSGKSESDLQAELLSHLTRHPYPYLITRESTKKSAHVHITYYAQDPDIFRDIMRDYLQQGKSAFMSKMYDLLNDKPAEYYFGYILKDWNVLHTNISQDKQQECYNTYKRLTVKTTDDMLEYVLEHYPNPSHYDTEWLLDTILDYHKHSNKVYDYSTILRREFHLCRLKMFETVERDYMRKHHNTLLGLL